MAGNASTSRVKEAIQVTTKTLPPATTLKQALGTVGAAMTSKVLVLEADTPADMAVRRLERQSISGAPVVRAGRVVGVVTLRDLLVPTTVAPRAQTSGPFLRYERLLTGLRVGDLMTAEPVCARTDWPLARAVLVMDETGVNRIPVVDPDGRPSGILTRDDVLRALASGLALAARRRVMPSGANRRATSGSLMAPD